MSRRMLLVLCRTIIIIVSVSSYFSDIESDCYNNNNYIFELPIISIVVYVGLAIILEHWSTKIVCEGILSLKSSKN